MGFDGMERLVVSGVFFGWWWWRTGLDLELRLCGLGLEFGLGSCWTAV